MLSLARKHVDSGTSRCPYLQQSHPELCCSTDMCPAIQEKIRLLSGAEVSKSTICSASVVVFICKVSLATRLQSRDRQ